MIGIGLTYSFNSVNHIVSKFDDDYKSVLNYATSQGYGLPSYEQQTLQNQLVLDLKNFGIWSELDSFGLQATNGSADFALVDWKRLITMTAVNSPTFITNVGYKGNGNDSYINTNYRPLTDGSNYTANDASFGVYWDSQDVVNSGIFVGFRDAFVTNESFITPYGNFNDINSNSADNRDSFSSISDFLQVQLKNGTQYLFSDGIENSSLTVTGVNSLTNVEVYYLCSNSGGDANTFFNGTIKSSYIGSSLLSKSLNFKNALQNYMNNI
jgi:hypothetical protein